MILLADKLAEYSIYAIAFFIPISVSFIEIFTGVCILAFTVKKMFSPDLEFLKRPVNFLAATFFIFCASSLFNNGAYIGEGLFALFFKWGKNILLFLAAQDILNAGGRVKRAVAVLLLAGYIVSADGLIQYFSGRDMIFGEGLQEIIYPAAGGLKAVTGPFRHYNDFAAYLVPILALSGAAVSAKYDNKAVLYSILSGLLLSGASLILTYSRGAWLGAVSAILCMLFLSRGSRSVAIILSLFILAVISLPFSRERVMFIFQAGGDAERYTLWQDAWGMVKENPILGKGLGAFMANISRQTEGLRVRYAHNCCLQIWSETGIFALASFFGFLFFIFRDGLMKFTASRDKITLGLICAIFGFLVHSLFDTHLYSVQLSAMFWLMSGVFAARCGKISLKRV